VSNLMFIGKFLERFAVNHLREYAGAHCLFPVHQSAYTDYMGATFHRYSCR